VTEPLQFHHVGVACRDLDAEARALAVLGYQAESPDFTDPGQGIQGRFIAGPGPRIELLIQTDGSSVLEPWLAKGVKVYHYGYEVERLDAELERLKAAGGIVVTPPRPAVAFGGRRISFVMLRNLFLVELIEAGRAERTP
jgi:catechol 2,3-dioxygenase-like lactoylglutathione lyase family enzyme